MSSLREIVQFKINHGFSDNPHNVVLASSNEVTGMGMGVGLAGMANAKYYLSFENDGILFMNLKMTGGLSGEISLLPLDEIKTLRFEREKYHVFISNGNSPLNSEALMIEGVDGKAMHLSIIRYPIGQAWLKENLNYIKGMLQG